MTGTYWINDTQASDIMGLSQQTLRNWRHLRKGPKYVKLGRLVKYHPDDIDSFMRGQLVDPQKDLAVGSANYN